MPQAQPNTTIFQEFSSEGQEDKSVEVLNYLLFHILLPSFPSFSR